MHTLTGVTLTQGAMAHFLSIGRYEHHLKKLRKVLHTQYLRYVQGIVQYFPADVKLSRPGGGFVLWVEMNKEVNAYKLYQEALKYGISIAPGQIFSATGEYRNCVRISYAHHYSEKVDEGLKILGGLVKRQSR